MQQLSQSQSGRGVVLTLSYVMENGGKHASQSQSGRGVVLTVEIEDLKDLIQSLNPSPAGG